MEYVFIIIILLLFLIAGAMMGFSANSKVGRLEQQLLFLRRQITSLEERLMGWSPPDQSGTEKPHAQPKVDPNSEPTTPEPIATVQREPLPVTAMAASAATLQNDGPPDWQDLNNAIDKIRAKRAAKPKRNMEFELGAKWTVWVGGLALLFGAVFLLRYTIESGFFTPGLRVIMASIFGTGLLACGEWLRRGENLPKGGDGKPIEFFESTYIPGILTAVGIFTLLGTVFAAHELYGFIGATPAFILMGLISLAALWLGLMHGPYVSALGLVAAFTTPALIQSEQPSMLALFVYLTIISFAAWALSIKRNWDWLVIASLLGSALWLFYALPGVNTGSNIWIWLAFFALMFAANLYFANDSDAHAQKSGLLAANHNSTSVTAISGLLAVTFLTLIASYSSEYNLHVFGGVVIVAALAGSLLYKPFLQSTFWVAALFGFLFMLFSQYSNLSTAVVFAAIIGAIGFVAHNRYEGVQLWAVPGVFGPLLILLASDGNYPGVENHILFGAFFLALAVLFSTSAAWLNNRKSNQAVISTYITGSAAAYVLGVVIIWNTPYENAALAIGIGLFTLLAIQLSNKRARLISLLMGLLTVVYTLMYTLAELGAVSERFLFNALWVYFALPAVIAFVSGHYLRKTGRDIASEGLMGLSIVFAVLFIIFQIRHYMTGGALDSRGFTFDELGLYVATGLAFTFGRKFMGISAVFAESGTDEKSKAYLHLVPKILTALSWITLSIFLVVLCFLLAPLFNSDVAIKGSNIINSLSVGYLIPVVLMAAILWQQRRAPSDLQSYAMRGLTLVGLLFYVTSQVRVFFSGMNISIYEKFPEGLESYVISASWLLIGVLTLAIGIRYDRKSFRLGSGIIIILTILKAFLLDMSTLDGVLRALSFVILGIVLIIIGRVYQKLLFDQRS